MKTYEETVADVLSRYSAQDLIEQAPGDMEAASRKFAMGLGGDLVVLERGTANLIHWWKIKGEGSVYEVRRFQNFVYCSCKSFFFRKKICKHAALSVGIRCWDCFLLSATGQLCNACEAKAREHRLAA